MRHYSLPPETPVFRALCIGPNGGARHRRSDKGLIAADWSIERAADFMWASAHASAWQHLVRERGWTVDDAARTVTGTLMATLLKS